jgi:hypothetical protein
MEVVTSPVLKVSVLASGSVLLNGEAVSLDQLQERIEAQKAARPVIWYYREAAQGEPPPEALQVMKLVVDNRLPISLCSKPDFSDYVDQKGRSHPRYTNWEDVVGKVREMTAGGKYVGIIRPDRSYLLMAPPPRDSVSAQMVQMMEKLVPPRPPRRISVIADTYFSWNVGGKVPNIPSLAEAGQAIPFFGILLGLACIGHSVCVFSGADELLAAGCKDADLLIVDDVQIEWLAADWKDVAKAAMRSPNVLVHDRATFKLKAI